MIILWGKLYFKSKRVIFFKDKLKSRNISFSGYINTTWSIYDDDIVYKVAP